MALGLVASLSHPGGNVTGVTSLNTEIASKRLGLFRELVPNAARYYALVNPTSPLTAPFAKDLQAGAKTLGIEVELLRASTDAEIAAAIESAARPPGSVLIFASDSFFYIRREAIAKLAAARAVPTVFDVPEYVEAGGLMSYGSDFSDVMQIAGRYTGRILKGEKPADLPVTQSEKFKLALNLKTAKALNLTAPPILLAQADEVIE